MTVAQWMAPANEHLPEPDLHPVAESDGELLCRIAERDLGAFESLYRRYVRPVYGLALSRLRDHEGAEEATRRAFSAIWSSAATYGHERGGGARWLFTVARNAIVDCTRALSVALPGPRSESPAEDGWLTFRVHAAVAELSEQEQAPLELAYWGGRSQSEIAGLLGLSLVTVETRTRSALARLAVRLEDVDDRTA
ncbi:MAG: RNA polymerase sigma factor [Gaiellaceae bacterium]